jgi:hypothetical protein
LYPLADLAIDLRLLQNVTLNSDHRQKIYKDIYCNGSKSQSSTLTDIRKPDYHIRDKCPTSHILYAISTSCAGVSMGTSTSVVGAAVSESPIKASSSLSSSSAVFGFFGPRRGAGNPRDGRDRIGPRPRLLIVSHNISHERKRQREQNERGRRCFDLRIVPAQAIQKRRLLYSVDKRGRTCCPTRVARRHRVVGDRHGLSYHKQGQ